MNFICVLRNANNNMKVQVAIAEKTELSPPSMPHQKRGG